MGFTLVAGLALVLVVGPFITSLAPAGGDNGVGGAPLPTPSRTVAPSAELPSAEELASTFLWQTLPVQIVVGDTTQVSLMFRNTGSTSWVKGTAAEARLGIVGDDASFHELGMGPAWPLPARRRSPPGSPDAPGQVATFNFSVTGTRAGTYRIPLLPVVDGVARMGDCLLYTSPSPRD